MGYDLTDDVCQPIISGQPIRNEGVFVYVNELAGVTGIYPTELPYLSAADRAVSLEARFTNRFDDTTYYGV